MCVNGLFVVDFFGRKQLKRSLTKRVEELGVSSCVFICFVCVLFMFVCMLVSVFSCLLVLFVCFFFSVGSVLFYYVA